MNTSELKYCSLSAFFIFLYRFNLLRKIITSTTLRLENGEYFTGTLRRILYHYHDVEVGAYSYGSCMRPGNWPKNVIVGRYSSIGGNVKVYLRNHPYERLSMHPFFYNKALGYVDEDNIPAATLHIGHDVWIGANSIITGGCTKIGNGAVIGAGSVVTKSVPDFSIVAGNPAVVKKFRFDRNIQQIIIKSGWWENPVGTCLRSIEEMVVPLTSIVNSHPLLVTDASSLE